MSSFWHTQLAKTSDPKKPNHPVSAASSCGPALGNATARVRLIPCTLTITANGLPALPQSPATFLSSDLFSHILQSLFQLLCVLSKPPHRSACLSPSAGRHGSPSQRKEEPVEGTPSPLGQVLPRCTAPVPFPSS